VREKDSGNHGHPARHLHHPGVLIAGTVELKQVTPEQYAEAEVSFG
jgi:hypothetical protein